MKVLLGLLLITVPNIIAMDPITLPPKKEIAKRLHTLGWQHFLEKTKIHKDLNQKQQTPEEIINYTKITILDYNENHAQLSPRTYKKYSTKPLTQSDEENMMIALFKDHPEIVATLKKNNA